MKKHEKKIRTYIKRHLLKSILVLPEFQPLEPTLQRGRPVAVDTYLVLNSSALMLEICFGSDVGHAFRVCEPSFQRSAKRELYAKKAISVREVGGAVLIHRSHLNDYSLKSLETSYPERIWPFGDKKDTDPFDSPKARAELRDVAARINSILSGKPLRSCDE